ncbi:MAG TPA: carboxylating nicotinate-nucleotide diphosphorylase [Bryobacteraceae bacterium]|nr:carboxylating nicotinate-nucleotide diphosphorylase [Bryobacteraceae bacterium]
MPSETDLGGAGASALPPGFRPEQAIPHAQAIIHQALTEDIGTGDVTTNACVPEHTQAKGYFLAREPLVLAGTRLLPLIYNERGGARLELLHHDGDHLREGDRIANVSGAARTLLECERVALNFLQRLSGVATLAGRYAAMVEGTNCRVLDTRKTTPGLRALEKAAAAAGGVTNHRMGLYDAVLIKNNHIAAAGGVRQAIENTRKSGLPIEIEVRTLEELNEALACGAGHLLLDNLSPQQAEEWVRLVNGRAKIELSGGINLETVRDYAETGADFVSVGAITHSARAMDISFRLTLEQPDR